MAHEPPTGFDTDFNLQCPYDGTRMEKVEAGKFTVDRCAECGGLWFDMAELQRILAHKIPAEQLDIGGRLRATTSRNDKPIKCPRDHSEMLVLSDIKQPHIKYHSCTVCGGMMLDAGELKDLSELTLTERLKSFFRM